MSDVDRGPNLDGPTLSLISPLWLRVDGELRLLELSPAAQRALGGAPLGQPLSTVLRLRRPIAAHRAADLLGRKGQVMVSVLDSGLPLQGVALAWGSGAALLLSPVVDSAQTLRAARLQVGDLGPLDPTSAHLMRDQLLRTTLTDATRLADELRAQNAELKKLRVEAEAAQLAAERLATSRADFLSTMSHELRTPLNGVLGTISLLGLQPLNPSAAQLQAVLQRSASGLRAIVDDVLDLARLEAGHVDLRREAFSIYALAHTIVSDFAAMAQARGLRLEAELQADHPPPLLGDDRRLRQVLSNTSSATRSSSPRAAA